jgi:hypothetical protein
MVDARGTQAFMPGMNACAAKLRLEPGQAVIPHGPDRELTVAEMRTPANGHKRLPEGRPRRG